MTDDPHWQAVTHTVNVTASATVDAVPDEAHVRFELSASDRSSQGALDKLGERTRKLDEVLDAASVPAEDRASNVRVSEQGERDGGRWLSKGYRAHAVVSVVVREAGALGGLVERAVSEAGPEFRGPNWRVSPDHPARLEACGKAAANARKKADAYVTALGSRLGDIVRVAEPGARTIDPVRDAAPPAPMAAAPAGAAGSAGAAPSRPDLTVHPGTMPVHAAVEVIFGIEPG